MTTRQFAENLQALIKQNMTFDALDGANFNIEELNEGDEAIVCSGKTPDEQFLLHIIKIQGYEKNHKGNGTKK